MNVGTPGVSDWALPPPLSTPNGYGPYTRELIVCYDLCVDTYINLIIFWSSGFFNCGDANGIKLSTIARKFSCEEAGMCWR